MNITESSGESSCKGQENGDVSNDTERPLKKARFAWQVKGKYHLKNEMSESVSTSETIAIQSTKPGLRNDTNSNDMDSEQKLETEDYPLDLRSYKESQPKDEHASGLSKQESKSSDNGLTDSHKTPSSSVSTEKYPRYISSCENKQISNVNRNSNRNHMTTPRPNTVTQSYTEDQCIERWQAKQIGKGYVDNRVNHVLESWMHAPLEEETNGFAALQVADFINNLPGDNSVENEGILMAISAHGLQNTSNSNTPCISPCNHPLWGRCLPTSESEDDDDDQLSNQHTQEHSNDLELNDNDGTEFSLFPNSMIHECSENKSSNGQGDDEIDMNHYDLILNQAVLFAIHNNGLTAMGAD